MFRGSGADAGKKIVSGLLKRFSLMRVGGADVGIECIEMIVLDRDGGVGADTHVKGGAVFSVVLRYEK